MRDEVTTYAQRQTSVHGEIDRLCKEFTDDGYDPRMMAVWVREAAYDAQRELLGKQVTPFPHEHEEAELWYAFVVGRSQFIAKTLVKRYALTDVEAAQLVVDATVEHYRLTLAYSAQSLRR